MNKRVISLALVLLMLATVMPLALAANMTWRAYVSTSNGGPLNLRAAPTKDGQAIASIPYGAEVTIKGDYNDGTWIDIYYKNWEGFVMRRYLSYDQPGPKPTHKPSPKPTAKPNPTPADLSGMFNGFQFINYTASVRPSSPAGTVNLRWAPSKSTGIILKCHMNDLLEVIAQNNTWAQVRDPQTGCVGFMMRSFLTTVAVGTGDGAVNNGADGQNQAPTEDTSSDVADMGEAG